MNPSAPDGNRVCGKQNCARPALVALTYDYRDRIVWLDDLGAESDPRAALLCVSCAERFTVPLGWQLQDRSAPAVEVPPPVAPLRSPAHPAVAVRGDHGAEDVDSSLDLRVPDEEHPSGPLNLGDRNEPKAVTLELERLARHLDTIPTPAAQPAPSTDEDEPKTASGGRPGIAIRPARPPAAPPSAPDLFDGDEDTFGDAVDDLTEELSVIGLSDAIWADEETQIEPPHWAGPA